MPKKKNPVTCRLQVGDRVSSGTRIGTLESRSTWVPSFNVRWDGQHYTSAMYRDQLKWIDPGPTEPEEYEAFFV